MRPRGMKVSFRLVSVLAGLLAVACTTPVVGGGGDGGSGGGSSNPNGGNRPGGAAGGGGGTPSAGTGGATPADGGVAGAVTIDPPGATFAGTQAVALSAPGGGDIRYTTDGALPTHASPLYRTPLALGQTAVVRAFVDRTGAPGPVAAASFVQLAEELRGWTSNLPVLVLHTHDQGELPAIVDAPFVAGSAVVLAPGTGGRTALLGRAALSGRAGMHVRGQSSVDFPQKSYSLELRAAGDDTDQARALLGLAPESDFALVGATSTDRSLMRNALAYAVSRSIGRWAPQTRFVEVFLVERGGAVRAADYRGVYTLAETIKRDAGRVDIGKLEPTALQPPTVTGGYIIRIDKGMANFTAVGTSFQYVYPDWEDIRLPGRAPQRGYLEGYVRELLESLAQPSFTHPSTGKRYDAYIDVPAFIDHNLLGVLFKNVDALRLSAYFHKPAGGLLAAGPVWDFDRSSGTSFDDDANYPISRALEPREWSRDDATHPLQWGFWARLFADPVFKAAHARRWDELAGKQFSPSTLAPLIDGFAAQLKEAQARHFTRWPETPPIGGSHQTEVSNLKNWFAARVPWVGDQL